MDLTKEEQEGLNYYLHILSFFFHVTSTAKNSKSSNFMQPFIIQIPVVLWVWQMSSFHGLAHFLINRFDLCLCRFTVHFHWLHMIQNYVKPSLISWFLLGTSVQVKNKDLRPISGISVSYHLTSHHIFKNTWDVLICEVVNHLYQLLVRFFIKI